MSSSKRPGKTYRVILDTNWYISASLSRRSRQTLRQVFADPRFRIIVCQELVDEYDSVISRPRFRKYISLPTVTRFRDLLLQRAIMVKIESFSAVNRDPKDSYLLDLARDANASHLITGDPDLFTEKRAGRTILLTMHRFRTRFRIR